MLLRLFMAIGLAALSPIALWADEARQVLAKGEGLSAPKQPQAFVSTDGLIDVVYAVGDEIHLTTSRDRGISFSQAKASIHCQNMSAGMRRGPRVVRTKSALIVTAIGGKQGKGRDGDLWAWRSTDQGTTWSDAVMVNDLPDAAREGLHGMAASSNGQVWSVWLDLRNGKTELFAASSHDDGQTWSKNVLVYRSPDGSICQCCHPSIFADSRGGVSILFRNALGGNRDMFLVRSDDGQKFSETRKLGQGSWKLDACPMDGGMLAANGKGEHITVWRREDHIFATSGDGVRERDLGPGQQPWVTWSAAGPLVVWTQRREGPLWLQLGLGSTARQLASNARDPVVASQPESNLAVVCWEAKQGGVTTVVAQVVD